MAPLLHHVRIRTKYNNRSLLFHSLFFSTSNSNSNSPLSSSFKRKPSSPNPRQISFSDIIKNLSDSPRRTSVPPPQDIFHKHKHRESAANADSEPGGERMELKEEKSSPTGTYSMALRDVLTVTHIHENNDDDSKKTSLQRLEMLKPPKEHLVEKYFHPDNMLSTEKLKIQPAKVRDEFKKLQSDCGSARVQDMEENPKKAKKSRGGGTCFWTASMDEVLIAAYLHQQTLGNTNGNCMTPSAMDNILQKLRNHFPDKPISKEKIKDHMKHMKGKFKNCYNIFKNGPSGFAWDATTNMWIAKPEVWDKLIEAKPNAAEWRNKPILYYDKLAQLFGKSQAVRVHAETAVELRAKGITYGGNGYDNTTEDENLIPANNITLEDFETVGEEFYANSSPKRPSNGHSQDTTSCRTKKRAKKNGGR